MDTIRDIDNQHEYIADVTHLKPFYHDPTYVVPLNIAVKDTDEYVIDQIVGYNPNSQWHDELDGQIMRH